MLNHDEIESKGGGGHMTSEAMGATKNAASLADRVSLAFALTYPTVLTFVYFVWLSRSSAGAQQTVYTAGKILQFAFPAVWVFWLARRAAGSATAARENAGRRSRGQHIAWGIGFGLLIFSVAVALYRFGLRSTPIFEAAAGPIREKVAGVGIDSRFKFALLGIGYSLVHAWLEEYYWRWFVFRELRQWVSFRAAAIISSLGFMAHHVLVLATYFGWDSFSTYFFSVSVAVGGLFWAWLYDRSQSLIGPWLSHMLVDAAIFAIGYDVVRESLN